MTKKAGSTRVTAGELKARLDADPEFQKRKAAREAELQHRVRRWTEAEQPLVEDLHAAGVKVESVWDLVNTTDPYPEALPVLMHHLESRAYPDRVMDGIGRAIGVGPALRYWDRLVAVLRAETRPGCAEGVAVALAACATKEQLPDLIELVTETELGDNRIHLLRAIKQRGGTEGRSVLESLANSEDLGQAARALLKRSS